MHCPAPAAPAVAAGNVETSSRVADLVLGAFGRALGQGTMNNLTLGNERFTYYETLGGGQGACPDADGPSGVHVAMSNTLNTPDRGARARVPAAGDRATRCAAAPGGAGAHRGGDGVVRELEALRADDLLADHRAPPPSSARRARRASLAHAGATCSADRELPGKVTGILHAGERLRIETPGGGGHGRP